tara:strand:- start:1975 stop:2550 length:576 start_codon:yes stop_codon:yes gene_type:complete
MADKFKKITSDLYRYKSLTGLKGFIFAYFAFNGFRVTFWFRITQYIQSTRLPRIVKRVFVFILLRQQSSTGVELNPGTEIGPGLYIPHGGGIVISPSSQIGSNCYISHGVTIGKVHTGPREGTPTLCDDVFLGPGVKVLGNLTIYRNAAVGANSVVLDDVPRDSFAAGMPARVVAARGASEIIGSDIYENH